ncbi:type II toxin-antitoxin system RelE family toxin [Myceligenerans xiligouense]|uniref:mRNA-degrading endonuclease RelE of RelBE toxin-antitoxin system n=1 Tax=Myceligenerans xiligouense TaxID=253184 RepID=A0A3N4ZPE8_9MICO|nr:type II toxin-antitoxin system RelE/ParE family toxin [Myceligenerans xiligouense]RPF22825.1 mRNA-degrading endonuclease RelE of RelBE toxin-antitoxin system [Myceligenerans xiligouense]
MSQRYAIRYTSAAEDALRAIKRKNWRAFDQVKASIAKQAGETRPKTEVRVSHYRVKLAVEGDKLVVREIAVEVRRYVIKYRRKAEDQIKEIRKGDWRIADQIDAAIKKLADNPRPHGVKKMAGSQFEYRIAVKDYRVVYEIDDDELRALFTWPVGRTRG